MAASTTGWIQSVGASRTKGVVGGVIVAALALGTLGVMAHARRAPDVDPTPAKLISNPSPIAADTAPVVAPARVPPPSAPPVAPSASSSTTEAALLVDAGSPVAPVAPVAPTPRTGKAPAPGNASPAKDSHAPRAAASSTHDDDIPSLR
jgi:hypothetical protein